MSPTVPHAPLSPERRRRLVLLALFFVPWTVLVLGGEFTLVFLFGLANTNPPTITNLYEYLFRFTGGFAALPAYLQSWPVSVLLYLGSLASAIGGLFGREDPRVTGGFLALAGVSHIGLATGLSRGVGGLVVPLGPVLALAVAWWLYWPLVRQS